MMCASTTLTPLRLSARVSPHLRVVADLDAGQSSSLTLGVNYCFFLLTECKVTVHKTCEAKVSYTFLPAYLTSSCPEQTVHLFQRFVGYRR